MVCDCGKFSHLIGAFVDDELPPPERVTVELHLQDCPRCREEAVLIRKMGAMLRDPVIEASERTSFKGLWESIEERISTEAPAKVTPRARTRERVGAHRSFWEFLPAMVRTHRVALASAVAGAAVVLLLTLPLLLTKDSHVPTPHISLQVTNDTLVDSVESSTGTVIVTKDLADQTTVIWLLDEAPAAREWNGESGKLDRDGGGPINGDTIMEDSDDI